MIVLNHKKLKLLKYVKSIYENKKNINLEIKTTV